MKTSVLDFPVQFLPQIRRNLLVLHMDDSEMLFFVLLRNDHEPVLVTKPRRESIRNDRSMTGLIIRATYNTTID